jgi:hypothetical protein
MRSTLSSAVGVAVALVSTLVLAQADPFRDAGGKIRGDIYWPSKAVTRHLETARGYAHDFQTYVAKTSELEPSVVADVKVQLGRYLDDATKHLATMKKDFAKDKETVAEIVKIEKDLAVAVDANKAMIECCENEKFDKVAGMACCTDLVKQLDKVHAAHQALMKKLTAKPAVPGKTAK